MNRLLVAGVLVALSGPAHAQNHPDEMSPADRADEAAVGREPVAPLEILRAPVRSATVPRGCTVGVLTVSTRAQLPETSEGAGQVGFFGRCRLDYGLQVHVAMPYVMSRWHSNFESTDHSEWGSPSLELKMQFLRIRGVRVAGYLAGAINWQQRASVVGSIEITGLVTPGVAASTIYRGLSIHANVDADLPFGARNGRSTWVLGLAVAYEPRRDLSLHASYQNANDLPEDSYWSDARVLLAGVRLRLSRGWSGEFATRVALNPEARLVFNSLGGTATMLNFLYEP